MSAPHRIDVHHHPSPPSYLSARFARDRQYAAQSRWSVARALEDMDTAGVATAMLSLPHAVHIWPDDVEEGRRLAREWNEFMARLAASHAGRFGVFAALPVLDIEGSLREIAHALDTLKADGVALMTNIGDKWLGDAHYAPIFEELDRRSAIVYTHPVAPDCCRGLIEEFNDSVIEYGTDTTRAIGKLLFSGSATRYPRIRFLFSHAGGTMPFLSGRFIRSTRNHPVPEKLPRGVMPELGRFFYDTAQSANAPCMAALRKVVSTSQILFGTDYPYTSQEEHVRELAECGFDAGEMRAIERGNAARLFPRLESVAHA